MRWGGVVDELEVASQLDQWRIHGYVDIDPSPGHLLSPYMNQVKIYFLKIRFIRSMFMIIFLVKLKHG